MALRNIIPVLLILPVAAVAVYCIGDGVVDTGDGAVHNARRWLCAGLAVYVINYAVAWFFKESFSVSVGRMLVCGVLAYISISELVDIGGENLAHLGQIAIGDKGALDAQRVGELRFLIVSWLLLLVMMIMCIGLGFESEENS